MSKKSHKKRRSAPRQSSPRQTADKPGLLPILLALTGIFIVILVITMVKQGSDTQATAGSGSAVNASLPSAQLEQALAQNLPVMVFMHSTDCVPCKQMSEIVDQVYPDFADQIALVDVNVYDRLNEPLMQNLGLQVIPTSVFFNRQGKSSRVMGVISPDELRSQFQELAGKS